MIHTNIQTGEDVVTFLKTQHTQVKALFEEVFAAQGEARAKAFVQLRRMMAVHETAEEEVVHPAAKSLLPNGEEIVEKRLHEENAAKKALAAIEKLDVGSPEFQSELRTLQRNVIAHAESEEKEEFQKLGARLDPKHLARMKKAVELVESMAPTRPHAGVESQAANMLVGPFASMVDRARDALSGKSS